MMTLEGKRLLELHSSVSVASRMSHQELNKTAVSYSSHLNNYRPVSNLRFIAKILEKLVLSQVSSYHNSHNLYNTCQSAYSPGHSTETALQKVANDLFLSLNKGNISVLALLDFF